MNTNSTTVPAAGAIAATWGRGSPDGLLCRARSLWRRARREPLLQFLALGALIFVLAHLAQRSRVDAARQIVVDDQLRQRIVEVNRSQSGITPAPRQLDRLVEQYVDDEVMYREALRMGLDRDDEIVRRRLIQKVQFLQRDLASAPAPGDRELRAYYDAHPDLFTAPASVSFEQLYFSADRGGWNAANARALRAREQREGMAAPIAQDDDPFPFQIASQDLTRLEASRVFGESPIVAALFSAPVGQWSEPIRSAYGWHLIRVSARRAPGVAPYEEVRPQVESAWRESAQQAAEHRELARLRARYEIVQAAAPGTGS